MLLNCWFENLESKEIERVLAGVQLWKNYLKQSKTGFEWR